ncbi:MAG: hypothetical protein DRP74_08415, partial [Candidatus Omnitrophota bacterium]
MEKRALGRGLGALIPEREAEKSEKITMVALDRIKPSTLQPRKDFDPQNMQELIQSIKEKGVIQPIIVRRRGEDFELIAGERRWRAAQQLNFSEMPVIIKDVTDRDSLEISLIENIQRQELNPIEEARAFQYLMDKYQVTQEELSDVLGKSRPTVANLLRLLRLPQEIQEEVRCGRLSFAQGRALLEVTEINQQRKLAQEIIAKGLSVRELENLIKSRKPVKHLKHRIRQQQR